MPNPADSNTNREEFAAAIRRAREARGWSQAELARRASTNIYSVSRWENGKSVPHLAQRLALLRALGLVDEEPPSMSEPAAYLGTEVSPSLREVLATVRKAWELTEGSGEGWEVMKRNVLTAYARVRHTIRGLERLSELPELEGEKLPDGAPDRR